MSTSRKVSSMSPVKKSKANFGMIHTSTSASRLAPSTRPTNMNAAMILSRMSRMFPSTHTILAMSVRSGSALTYCCSEVASLMLWAVMRSPFISNFWRADEARGTANHMMM